MKPSNKGKTEKISLNQGNGIREDQPDFHLPRKHKRLPKYELAEPSYIKFKFNDQQRQLLKMQGIVEDLAVSELEKVVIEEYSRFKIQRSIRSRTLSAKQERAFIDKLKKSVTRLLKDLRAVRKLSMEFQVSFTENLSPFWTLREELKAFDYFLHRITGHKDSAGNKKKDDLAYLVVAVVRLMLRYGITPKKRGKQLKAILSIILGSLDEIENKNEHKNIKQMRNAIKYAWPGIELLIHGSPRLEE